VNDELGSMHMELKVLPEHVLKELRKTTRTSLVSPDSWPKIPGYPVYEVHVLTSQQ
jgi:hypothetical protein